MIQKDMVLFNVPPVELIDTLDDIEFTDDYTSQYTSGLLQADLKFAEKHGGPFVKSFCDRIRNDLDIHDWLDSKYRIVIDSKVHMLMQNQYPCIPGWHVDFAPDWTKVVNWSALDENELHFMAISSDISSTQFVKTQMTINVPRVPKVSGFLSRIVDAYVREGEPVLTVQPNKIYKFNQLSIHAGMPAKRNGWRVFIRASITRLRPVLNIVRAQPAQIYVTDLHEGW